MTEKRKYTRFRTLDKGYAAIRGKFTKVGKIIDISFNGLAFTYLTTDKQKEEVSHVDIFLVENEFHLAGVPCTIIYDVKGSNFCLNDVSSCRCGMKFGPLREEQQNKLEFFLNNHTTCQEEYQ